MKEPNPILATETRPSRITGHSWHAVLTYKEHHFEAELPFDFPVAKEDPVRLAIEILPVYESLRAKLAPILVKEDEERLAKRRGHLTLAPLPSEGAQ